MKKIFVNLTAVCLMIFGVGMTSCTNTETLESQIFDLTYDDSNVEQGEITIYQLNYEPIFIQEISKVAKPTIEGGKTFMVNASEKKAKDDVKAAFDAAAKQAQSKAGDPSSIKGLKVVLKYSTASNQKQVDFVNYTFK